MNPVSLTLLSVVAAASLTGADAPIHQESHVVGPSQSSPGHKIEERCEVYPEFAVVSREDPGVLGAEIDVRPRRAEMPVEALCRPEAKGGARHLEVQTGATWGVSGPFVFVQSADSFGLLRGVEIFDARDGKRIVNLEIDEHEGLQISHPRSPGNDLLHLKFQLRLVLSCAPGKDGVCWQRVRKENKVPEQIVLRSPQCPAMPKGSAQAQDVLQVTAPAQIELTRSDARVERTFRSGRARCALTP